MLWKWSKLPLTIIVQKNFILKINFIHPDQFCVLFMGLLPPPQYLSLMVTWIIGNNCLWVDPSCLHGSNIDHKSSNILDILDILHKPKNQQLWMGDKVIDTDFKMIIRSEWEIHLIAEQSSLLAGKEDLGSLRSVGREAQLRPHRGCLLSQDPGPDSELWLGTGASSSSSQNMQI